MRAVIQRVDEASVTIGDRRHAAIGRGLLILFAVEEADGPEDVEWLAGKIARLRIFPDDAGLMNRDVGEIGGDLLVVSQFTLYGSTRKGNRPSFIRSARPAQAIPIYEGFLRKLAELAGRPVATGEFGAMMKVGLVNDGPVTLIIDTRLRE
ncbi:MAG: D-tyrosyl-tRNA(Tyr) deacylase [Verrucomicrobiales bacterium]|nr:D-tyrosyl-tRNA(Tyr) deacylase [Verrucomicrobiales bacterium]